MPQPMEFNEARGSIPDHLTILQNRIRHAEEELQRAQEKPAPLRAAAVENAQRSLDEARDQYKQFVEGTPEAQRYLKEKPETIQ